MQRRRSTNGEPLKITTDQGEGRHGDKGGPSNETNKTGEYHLQKVSTGDTGSTDADEFSVIHRLTFRPTHRRQVPTLVATPTTKSFDIGRSLSGSPDPFCV